MMSGLSAIVPYNLATYGLLEQGLPQLYSPPLPKWIGVRQRFEQFHRDLSLTASQLRDGHIKRAGVVNCLNRNYYERKSIRLRLCRADPARREQVRKRSRTDVQMHEMMVN